MSLGLVILLSLVVVAPVALVALIGLPSLVGQPLSERTIDRSARLTTSIGLLACLTVFGVMIATGERHLVLNLGNWVEFEDHTPRDAHEDRFHFAIKFEFDRLSIPFATLSFLLCGTIGAFASRYMHREPGYNRFFFLYALFLLGMVTASLADTIETLFLGWELVGLSSALLIAFFQDRPSPPRNGLRVWIVYRVSDAALLLAAVVLHHVSGEGDFDKLISGGGHWPDGRFALSESQAILIGVLLLFAAAGKSALIPFSGWLPRAMEGPTPSSAVFYGALSVHLGAYLLLRMNPLIAASFGLAVAVIVLGLTTSLFAYLVGSVQTDIKSALSFASLAQVGIIVAEIGAGYWWPMMWYVALVHLLSHACLRTLQFVRAPSLLRDYRELENAIGERLPQPPGLIRFAPAAVRSWIYRFALERGYLDAFLTDFVTRPFVAIFRGCNRLEERWTRWLNGTLASLPNPDANPTQATLAAQESNLLTMSPKV